MPSAVQEITIPTHVALCAFVYKQAENCDNLEITEVCTSVPDC